MDIEHETAAIQSRIDAAAARGGGRVEIAPGVHRCGTLYLRSGVELRLEEGAVLEGGSHPEDYCDAIPEDMVYRYSDAATTPTVTRKAALFADNAEDIAITGRGEIRIEAEQRMINSDGIDFDGCRHVRVADSFFKTGDDCVVLRAIRLGHPGEGAVATQDVVVENCSFDTPCQGVRIGCPSNDTIRDVVFRDISFRGRNAIGSQQPRHYLNAGDNGCLRTADILFENWRIKGECPLELYVGDGIGLRDFGHMTFRNFSVETERPFVVKGNEATPVRRMRFENIRGSVKSGKAFDVEHAPGIAIEHMDVTAKP